MKVVVWHNPKCGTSRRVVELIRARGIAPTIVEYLVTPPSPAEIAAVLQAAGIGARALLRRRGTPYDELGLDDPALGEAALVAAMAAHPALIERPVVRTNKGTRVCRPPERVIELL